MTARSPTYPPMDVALRATERKKLLVAVLRGPNAKMRFAGAPTLAD